LGALVGPDSIKDPAFVRFVIVLLDDGMSFDELAAAAIDELLVIVGSDFSRTPYYNSGDGKDHWPIGSYIIMEKGARYTNRLVDGTDELQNALAIDLKTLNLRHQNPNEPRTRCPARLPRARKRLHHRRIPLLQPRKIQLLRLRGRLRDQTPFLADSTVACCII